MDEFKDRDAQGLMPRKKDGPTDDDTKAAKAATMYMKLIFVTVPAIQLVLATGTYFLVSHFQPETLAAKFRFLHTYDLGYVYLAIYIIGLGRGRLMVNANSARAGARIDRPDQHIYKVMDPNGAKDAPYVLMATTGWAGKFNRAQRALFNTDETMPQTLVTMALGGALFGPAIVCVALLIVYGRVKFALLYTETTGKRGGGFLPAVIGENWAQGDRKSVV